MLFKKIFCLAKKRANERLCMCKTVFVFSLEMEKNMNLPVGICKLMPSGMCGVTKKVSECKGGPLVCSSKLGFAQKKTNEKYKK